MAKRQKITAGQFKVIKDHWDICTKDGCGPIYPKDINGLEKILGHCGFCHHIPDILPSQKDKLLERLTKIDAHFKTKRYS